MTCLALVLVPSPLRSTVARSASFFAASFRRSTSVAIAARTNEFRDTAMGVLPSQFREARFALAARSASTHRVSPRSHARCSGVFPSALGRETSTGVEASSPLSNSPPRTRALIVSRCPPCAARSNATERKAFRVSGVMSGGDGPSTRERTVTVSPTLAAAMSAARYDPLSERAAATDDMATRGPEWKGASPVFGTSFPPFRNHFCFSFVTLFSEATTYNDAHDTHTYRDVLRRGARCGKSRAKKKAGARCLSGRGHPGPSRPPRHLPHFQIWVL